MHDAKGPFLSITKTTPTNQTKKPSSKSEEIKVFGKVRKIPWDIPVSGYQVTKSILNCVLAGVCYACTHGPCFSFPRPFYVCPFLPLHSVDSELLLGSSAWRRLITPSVCGWKGMF